MYFQYINKHPNKKPIESAKTSRPLENLPEINDCKYSSQQAKRTPNGKTIFIVFRFMAFILLVERIPKIKYSTKWINLSHESKKFLGKAWAGNEDNAKIKSI